MTTNLLTIFMLFLPLSSAANDVCVKPKTNNEKLVSWCECEKSIQSQADLRNFCESKSEEYYRSLDIKPYNWTSKYWSKGPMLFVKGEWKVKSKRIEIECRIHKGDIGRYATIEEVGSKLVNSTKPAKIIPHCLQRSPPPSDYYYKK